MTPEQEKKYNKVMRWIKEKDTAFNLSGLASIAGLPDGGKFALIKSVKYNVPMKAEYVDKVYDCIERVFKTKL